ncbi:hypothetical protein [Thermodesulfovibrio yellowstonii]|uniref:hypothetical protein n=1 Tax=Thermodesulfovibrio yellowstonii TaxID=28262 RepID=UPI00042497F6|nr:hypothetical protein [Thermodesulfovibrio islandicus]
METLVAEIKPNTSAWSSDARHVEAFASIVDAITELSEKYEIPFEEAVEYAENWLSFALSEYFGLDIQVYLKGKCSILVFFQSKVEELKIYKIKKEALKHAKEYLEYRFQCLHAYKVFEDARKVVKTVVYAKVIRTINQTVYARFHNPHAVTEGGRVLIGSCPLEHQTPKERGTYREGMILPFFVTSVRGIVDGKVPRVIITLSRNSISLPEVLLREILQSNGIFTRIRAVRRIAGAYTEIHAEEKIPKEFIKQVSQILKEGIIVKYGESDIQINNF